MCVCVKNTSPEPEPGIENETALQTAVQLWTCVTSGTLEPSVSQPTDFTLEMTNMTPFGLLWLPCVIGQTIIFLPCGFYLSSSFFFFSSPNLSGRRLAVYHTSTHGVALEQI